MSWPAEARALLADLFRKEEKPVEAKGEPSAADLRAGLKEIREHLRRLGAALAAGASALLVGLGWVQLHNVFPAPANHRLLVPFVAFLSSAAALIGIGWLLRMIFAAQRRIPIVTDTESLGTLGSLDEREKEIRRVVFSSVAEEQEAASLRAIELEARECERKAEAETNPVEKERLEARARRLLVAVDEGMAGAAMLILEERSGNVFRGGQPIAAFVLASLGIIVAFGVADYSKGQRDLIALRKSCAEAAAAGVKDPCESVVDFEATPPKSDGKNTASRPTGITIGVRRRGANCAVSVRVDGKETRATKSGMAKLTINDFSRSCGVQLTGGGLLFRSGWRHTGSTTAEARLTPLSYSVAMLQVVTLKSRPGSIQRVREVPVEPLVAAPEPKQGDS